MVYMRPLTGGARLIGCGIRLCPLFRVCQAHGCLFYDGRGDGRPAAHWFNKNPQDTGGQGENQCRTSLNL